SPPPLLPLQPSSSSNSLPPPPSSSSNILEHHASLQTSLLSSLTSMSSQLKTNSQAFSDSLEKDKEVMLAAQDKLDANLTTMKKEGGRLGGYGKKGKGMVWITVGLVGAVAAMWVGMFLLIKVT
ncbi:unconventional SNARE in the endoplasmic reticulum protein 1, partial [Phenoliferia sp. Uapishka_3]